MDKNRTDRLEELTQYASKTVPFYRSGGARRFADLPIISKQAVISRYGEFLSDGPPGRNERICALCLNRDSDVAVANQQIKAIPGLVIEQTTGTTGLPGRFVKSNLERVQLSAVLWRQRQAWDPSINARSFRALIHLPYAAQADERCYSEDPSIIVRLYEEFRTQRVRWIHTNPYMLRRHLQVLRAAGLAHLPQSIFGIESAGARLPAPLRKEAEQFFGCRIFNQYGCIETWAMGYELEGNGLMALLEDSVHVELVDDSSGQVICEPGQVGAVAVTSLIIRLMPVMRYLTGDRGEWVEEGGRRYLRLHEDRTSNLLLVDGARVAGTQIFRDVLATAIRDLGYFDLEYIQFLQIAERTLRVRMAQCPRMAEIFGYLQQMGASGALSKQGFALELEPLTAEQVEGERRKKEALFVSRL